MKQSCDWWRVSLALIVVFVALGAPYVWAQTLGTAPQLGFAVQGQKGAQPEGAFFNFINWIGNVIAPVGAGVARGEVEIGIHQIAELMPIAGIDVVGDLMIHDIDAVLHLAGQSPSELSAVGVAVLSSTETPSVLDVGSPRPAF